MVDQVISKKKKGFFRYQVVTDQISFKFVLGIFAMFQSRKPNRQSKKELALKAPRRINP
jgi:hypothetical protein